MMNLWNILKHEDMVYKVVNGKYIELVTTTLVLVVVWNGYVLHQIINMLMGNHKERLILNMYDEIQKMKSGT